MSRPLAMLLILPAVSGCATVTTIRPEEPAPPIEVRISAPAAEVFRRTLAAFAAEGLTVAQAEESGGVIASAPIMGEGVVVGGLEVVTMQTYLTYRANVIAAPDGTSVVRLSLWARTQTRSS